MTLLHLTDLHLFADPAETLMGWPTAASFAEVLTAAQRHPRPDAVVLTGDLTQDGAEVAYARLALDLRAFGCPCLWLPGNHDAPDAMATAFQPFPWMHGGVLDLYAHEGRGGRLVALDTHTTEGDHGVLAASELQRLEATLGAARDRPTVVTLHHQPLPVGAAWLDAIGLHDAEAFWQVVERHPQVRGVLFGHVHQAFEAQRGAVRILGTPATCFQFAPGTPDFALDAQEPAFRLLDLRDDGTLHTTVHRVPVAARCAPTSCGYA